MIEPGTYVAEPIGHQWGLTKGGKEQVVVEFRITEGDATGNVIAWFGYFTEKTWSRTMEALRYCGWKGDDISNLDGLDQPVEIVVEHEEDDEGKLRAKVRWVNRVGAGRVTLKTPMDSNAVRRFAAEMKSRARSVAEVTPGASGQARQTSTPSSRTEERPPPPTDDDLPF